MKENAPADGVGCDVRWAFKGYAADSSTSLCFLGGSKSSRSLGICFNHLHFKYQKCLPDAVFATMNTTVDQSSRGYGTTSIVCSPSKPFLTVKPNVSPSPSTVLPEPTPRMLSSSSVTSRTLFPPFSSSPSWPQCPSIRLYMVISSGLTSLGGSDVSFNAPAISTLRVWIVEDGARRRSRVVLYDRTLRINAVSEAYFGG
jgi:hypothetical protein